MPNHTTSTLNTDVQIDSNIDFAFVKEAILVSSTGTVTNFPVINSYFDSDTETITDMSNTAYINGSSKKLRIHQNNSNSNGKTYYITVRYTKTTD